MCVYSFVIYKLQKKKFDQKKWVILYIFPLYDSFNPSS